MAKDTFGKSPLHFAAEYGRAAAVRYLLDHACFKGRLEVTQLLVSRGADIHARNGSGQTPLARAAGFHPYPELVDFLIKQGADVNAGNHKGQTPADKTSEFSQNEKRKMTREFLLSRMEARR